MQKRKKALGVNGAYTRRGRTGIITTPTTKKMPVYKEDRDLQEVFANSRRINRGSFQYYESHFESMKENHGGEVVAIVDTSVVASIDADSDIEVIAEFISQVREEHGDEAFITEIPEPDQSLVL